ncbi:sigma factor [Kitasatospora fiedleri]|uniref:sigma factor n=1 Tax=Kitasatospora fiedleri TaxID=2991545 RepID=UPI00249AF3EB|nr:sigma factor [Kitasatospora fiedleri]
MARADRSALMPATDDGPPVTEAARRAVAAVWRIESARVVGALARWTGDFALAEDVAQEALAEALVRWSRDGAPAEPVGWLLTTARRRAVDAFRRRSALDSRYALLAGPLAEGEAHAGAAPGGGRPTTCRGTRTGSTTTCWRWCSPPATRCSRPRPGWR